MATVDRDPSFNIPIHFTHKAIPHDRLVTETSKLQDETVSKCLPYLLGTQDPARNVFDFNEYGVPRLETIDHIDFLHANLEDFPAPFVAADASRPWMVYWALNGLALLGEDVSRYRRDVLKTFTPCQNQTGGFGGGHGQLSHLAGSYAALLSIALVGGRETYSMISREAMWRWLGHLKLPDGGFQICKNGEVDSRGAYSAMVLITLLNLPLHLPSDSPARTIGGLETFTDGLAEWISRSQTFQGGIGGYPGNEAHGAYTFLGVACLCLMGSPHVMLRKYLDLDSLITWLSMQQYAPEGGLAGRINKPVDGCYSHWTAGSFPLVQAALQGPLTEEEAKKYGPVDLFDREGLVRYTLSCCQQKYGGLRDKPGKRADAYHTNYTLSGLSQCQHFNYYTTTPSPTTTSSLTWHSLPLRPLLTSLHPSPPQTSDSSIPRKQVSEEEEKEERDTPSSSSSSSSSPRIVYDEADEIQPIHPIFVISHTAVKAIREWAESAEVCAGDSEWI